METKASTRLISTAGAFIFIIVACIQGYRTIGLPPVIIVGGSGVIGFLFWFFTYLKRPVDPKIILPLFLLTVAGLEIHMMEEYLTQFGPSMSRLFNISWTEKSFLMIFAFIGPVIYTLTALGLFYRIPLAGFFAWFIFIGPGVAEFTHFIFPILQPCIEPDNPDPVSFIINGTTLENTPNYYFKTTGRYYFSGLYTAVLPMIPGIYAIYRVLQTHLRQIN
ncbi:hypothetical protein [Chryseosolibacter indicus]|uniref:Uncharacterized protein n=1 Tax=Chryseosolibacter indicus TaxID=2782351 RepID=A0ABS5VQM6_9BACT|nr:hypothetical protein [Chryseosolibacter indicus]MBT1703742.1 hypothetical protein [Chryseosolibacter indicus]